MSKLTHPATGHQINVDDESADFWKAAGYREADSKSTTKKAPAKKSASSSKSK